MTHFELVDKIVERYKKITKNNAEKISSEDDVLQSSSWPEHYGFYYDYETVKLGIVAMVEDEWAYIVIFTVNKESEDMEMWEEIYSGKCFLSDYDNHYLDVANTSLKTVLNNI